MSDVLQNLAPKTRFALLSSSVGGLKSKNTLTWNHKLLVLKQLVYMLQNRKITKLTKFTLTDGILLENTLNFLLQTKRHS